MKINLEIKRPIESQNKSVGRHWAIKHKKTKEWEVEIWAALNKYRALYGKEILATGKAYLSIESVRKRLLDYGNLVGGCKGLVDALKRLELIKDDSPRWVEVEYKQTVGTPERTIIQIDNDGIKIGGTD